MAGRIFLGYTNTGPTISPEFSTDVSVELTGEVTMPRQSAFLAVLGAGDTNVTGAGTTYTLGTVTALTEIFDQNNDFNTNGTFTAPITGRYHFDYKINSGSITAAMTNGSISIVTSNRTYPGGNCSPSAVRSSGNAVGFILSVLADMDAADTATFTLIVQNGAGDTASAQAIPFTYVSGSLEC